MQGGKLKPGICHYVRKDLNPWCSHTAYSKTCLILLVLFWENDLRLNKVFITQLGLLKQIFTCLLKRFLSDSDHSSLNTKGKNYLVADHRLYVHTLVERWGLHSPCHVCVLCIQFVRQGKQTYLNFPSPGRQCLAANIPGEGGVGVGYLRAINTSYSLPGVFFLWNSNSFLFNSCKTLLSLFIFLSLWFVAVKQVETPTVYQS